ncbi:TPA: phage tail protein, partial [Streptococcus suis]
VGQSASETSFTIGDQVIKLEKLSETLVMVNVPDNPSFKTASGKLIKWNGDFITIDPTTDAVGVVLGPGIQSLKFETVWGWA